MEVGWLRPAAPQVLVKDLFDVELDASHEK
jgi:hypothetical protein